MDNATIEKTLQAWATENKVTPQSMNSDGQPYFELRWQRLHDGAHAYIDVYPQEDDVIIVQHGIALDGGPRQHGGINRWCSRDLRSNLTHLKAAIDQSGAPQHRSYTPRPKLGTVASLKLR